MGNPSRDQSEQLQILNIQEISRDAFPRLPPCVLLHGPASRGRLQLQLHKVGQLEGCFPADQLWLPMFFPHILRLCWLSRAIAAPSMALVLVGVTLMPPSAPRARTSPRLPGSPTTRGLTRRAPPPPSAPWSAPPLSPPFLPPSPFLPAPHHPIVAQPAYPEVFNPYPEPPLDCRVPIAGCPDFVPNPAPTDAFVPTNVFPDNVRGDNSNNVDDNIFPDNVRSQDLSSSEVNFGEPTK